MLQKTVSTEIVLSNEIVFYVDDEPYIFQGLSGIITALDGVSEAIIKYMKRNKPINTGEIVDGLSTTFSRVDIEEAIDELIKSSVLYEQGDRKHPLVRTTDVPNATELPIATLVFHLINSCNLGCTYCYAGDGEYGAPQKVMSQQTATDAIDFLIRESKHLNDISVILFGGEPFLNWKQLKYIVEYGKQAAERTNKNISFSLTTNGTLLNDERIAFIKEHNIGVSVSMDGDEKTQDKWRPFQNGAGSYKLVSSNVRKLVAEKSGKPVAARVTLTKGFPYVRDTLHHLFSLGFHEVGFAPVTETDEMMMLARPEMMDLLDQFEELANDFIESVKQNEYLGFSNLTNLLSDLHQGQTKAYGCGAGLGFMAVSPGGDLYLCHRFNEDPEVQLGDIYQGINREFQQKLLKDLHVDTKTTCSRCPLKHSCAGGCYYEAKEQQGEITAPNLHYCNWMLRWTKIGLETYVRIMKEDSSFMDRMTGTNYCQTN
ncbi:radical SAM/SPASM domain-containing protein [Bacillus sp. FJAT-45350]|uniref:radical SAM/SPASM domain-containing protein n=1 Tax=Bacillus sp. FJAT-45350 TaxID=2011014 RepID=UPI000BB6DA7F|nr:radical SAM protein [Bacillus sp. FJAT-45350]